MAPLPGAAGNAALVDCLRVVPEVVIVRAVDLPVVLIWTVAVHRAALIEPGCQIKQRTEVAPSLDEKILSGRALVARIVALSKRSSVWMSPKTRVVMLLIQCDNKKSVDSGGAASFRVSSAKKG